MTCLGWPRLGCLSPCTFPLALCKPVLKGQGHEPPKDIIFNYRFVSHFANIPLSMVSHPASQSLRVDQMLHPPTMGRMENSALSAMTLYQIVPFGIISFIIIEKWVGTLNFCGCHCLQDPQVSFG